MNYEPSGGKCSESGYSTEVIHSSSDEDKHKDVRMDRTQLVQTGDKWPGDTFSHY